MYMEYKKYNALLTVLICLSSLVFAASFTTRNLMKQDVVDFIKNITNMENVMMDKITIDDRNLDQDQYNDLIILENTVRNDEKVKQISERVTPFVIHDLIFGSTHDISFVKTEFKTVLMTYWDRFHQYIPTDQIDVYTERTFLEPLEQWRIDSYYRQQLTRIKTMMSLPLMILMFIIYIVSQLWVTILSGLLFILCVGILCYRTFFNKQWLRSLAHAFYGSGACILLCLFTCKLMYTILPYQLTQYIGSLHPSSFYIMGYFAIGYLMIGICINIVFKHRHLSSLPEKNNAVT